MLQYNKIFFLKHYFLWDITLNKHLFTFFSLFQAMIYQLIYHCPKSVIIFLSAPVCILCYVCLTAHDSCRALAWSNLAFPVGPRSPSFRPKKSVHCGSEMTRTTRVTPFFGSGPAFFAFNCPKRSHHIHGCTFMRALQLRANRKRFYFHFLLEFASFRLTLVAGNLCCSTEVIMSAVWG